MIEFDLLGDPIPENFGKRGRPPHIPTDRNRNKVMLLLASGWLDARIAQSLQITKPTLKKHYFRELRQRDDALSVLQANVATMLYEKAASGDTSAIKELARRVDLLIPGQIEQGIEDAQADKAPALGKKEQAKIAADTAGEGTEWRRDLLGPPDSVH